MESNSMNLKVTPRRVDDNTQALDLEGEVDVYTAPLLRQEIMDQVDSGVKTLLVDLNKVEYLDSTGLGILIGGVKRLKEQGGSLRLIGPSARITRIFEITGLNKIFDVYANRSGCPSGKGIGASADELSKIGRRRAPKPLAPGRDRPGDADYTLLPRVCRHGAFDDSGNRVADGFHVRSGRGYSAGSRRGMRERDRARREAHRRPQISRFGAMWMPRG